MLFPFEKIRVKPGTVLIETVLSGDPLYHGISDLGITLPHLFLCLSLDMFNQN